MLVLVKENTGASGLGRGGGPIGGWRGGVGFQDGMGVSSSAEVYSNRDMYGSVEDWAMTAFTRRFL